MSRSPTTKSAYSVSSSSSPSPLSATSPSLPIMGPASSSSFSPSTTVARDRDCFQRFAATYHPRNIDMIPLFMAFGFSLSAYAYYVEFKLEESKRLGSTYTAACDIGIFSCTKVFSSEFGYMSQFLGLPRISNAVMGMLFYAFIFFLHFLTTIPALSRKTGASGKPFWPTVFSIQRDIRGIILSALAGIGVFGVLASCALFYILTIKMHDLCIVCCSIYVTNFSLCFLTGRRYIKYCARRARIGGVASPLAAASSDKWIV